jgi:hypothetical protein
VDQSTVRSLLVFPTLSVVLFSLSTIPNLSDEPCFSKYHAYHTTFRPIISEAAVPLT